MSASPVMDMRGKVLGVYGISRLEIIKSFVLQKGGLLKALLGPILGDLGGILGLNGQKMILVDPAQLMFKKANPIPDTLSDSAVSLDREMKEILDSNIIPLHEKVIAFQAVLQRYLNKVDQYQNREERSIFKGDIKERQHKAGFSKEREEEQEEEEEKEDKTIKLEKRVVESVPKSLQNKARLLIEHLKDTSDLGWNERGEITIRGEKIKNSNISDLVNTTLRSRKHEEEPTGWKDFVSLVKESNVPINLIGNKTRWLGSKSSASGVGVLKRLRSPKKRINHTRSSKNQFNWLSFDKKNGKYT